MFIDIREWLPDLYQYKLTILCLLGQLAFARRAADLAWFVPVYVWGLESLHHLSWWLFGNHGFCWGPPIISFFSRCFLSCLVMAATVGACFASEQWARQNGRAVRPAQATLPVPIVAAILGVQWTWGLHVLVFLPFRYVTF